MFRTVAVLCALVGCKASEPSPGKPVGGAQGRAPGQALDRTGPTSAQGEGRSSQMTYDVFAEGAWEALGVATSSHEQLWGLGTFDRWNLNQDEGILRFKKPGLVVEAPAQILGSYSTTSGTWLWAWDNETIEPAMAKDAEKVRAYGAKHGYERLTTAQWEGTEEEAWEVSAVAMRITVASGVYRGPAGPGRLFISFGEVKIIGAEP